jgi:hypothetical protein
VATDQNTHSPAKLTTQNGHHEQPAVPKSEDDRPLFLLVGNGLEGLFIDFFDPHGKPYEPDQPIGEKGKRRKNDSLTQSA